MESLILNTSREGYSTSQCYTTLTVGELIEELSNYDEDTPVYFGNDRRGGYWYTYGSISYDDIELFDGEEEKE